MYSALRQGTAARVARESVRPVPNANHRPLPAAHHIGSVALNSQAVMVDPGTAKFFTAEELEAKKPLASTEPQGPQPIPQETAEEVAERMQEARAAATMSIEEIRANLTRAEEDAQATAAEEAKVADSLKSVLPKELLFQESMKKMRVGKAIDLVVEVAEKVILEKQRWGMKRWREAAEKLRSVEKMRARHPAFLPPAPRRF